MQSSEIWRCVRAGACLLAVDADSILCLCDALFTFNLVLDEGNLIACMKLAARKHKKALGADSITLVCVCEYRSAI